MHIDAHEATRLPDRIERVGSAGDVVEAALADAITKAAAAGRYDALAQLVAELEARRKSRSATVDLAAERAKRAGKR